MNKDIYDMLNDSEFDLTEYDVKKFKEDKFNDIEKRRAKQYIKKNSKIKRNYKKIVTIVTIVATVVIVLLSNSTIRNEVWARIQNVTGKYDESKNTSVDYVVELTDRVDKDGVQIKLEEAYRNVREVRIIYSMTFENGIPESIKNIESPPVDNEEQKAEELMAHIKGLEELYKKDEVAEFIEEEDADGVKMQVRKDNEAVKAKKKEFQLKRSKEEKERYSGFDILANGISLLDVTVNKENSKKSGIWLWRIRNLSIDGNTIKKEAIINLKNVNLKNDINIDFEYKDIKENNESVIGGPWKIRYTIKASKYENQIPTTKLEKKIKYTLSSEESFEIEKYSYTNTGLKIYGVYSHSFKDDMQERFIRLQGKDNLGNEVLMYPYYLSYDSNKSTNNAIFELYNGPKGENDDIPKFDSNATSITVGMYEESYEINSMWDNIKWSPVGEKFTINLK